MSRTINNFKKDKSLASEGKREKKINLSKNFKANKSPKKKSEEIKEEGIIESPIKDES